MHSDTASNSMPMPRRRDVDDEEMRQTQEEVETQTSAESGTGTEGEGTRGGRRRAGEDVVSVGVAITLLVQTLREKYREVVRMLKRREVVMGDDWDILEDKISEIVNLADGVINLMSKTVSSTFAQRMSHKLYQHIRPLQEAYTNAKLDLLQALDDEDLANLLPKLRTFMTSFERLYGTLQTMYVGRERVRRREVEMLIAPYVGTIMQDIDVPSLSPESRKVIAILLANGGEIPLSQLALALGKEQVARAVAELERRGFARRVYDPSLGEDKLVLNREE